MGPSYYLAALSEISKYQNHINARVLDMNEC